ncbi:hypothetical protein RZS08_45130, partial [Arthrospira platensis SPKY1]|nr:hypothetical protein [Arthrospira platensis SPKY1]
MQARLERIELLNKTKTNLLTALKGTEAMSPERASRSLASNFQQKWLAYRNLNLIISDESIRSYRRDIAAASEKEQSLGPSTSLPACSELD